MHSSAKLLNYHIKVFRIIRAVSERSPNRLCTELNKTHDSVVNVLCDYITTFVFVCQGYFDFILPQNTYPIAP